MSQRSSQRQKSGPAPTASVRIRGTARGKPTETIEPDLHRLPEDYPFPVGSVVKLKSGGIDMTVVAIIDTCAERGAIVEVVWSSPNYETRLSRDKLPRQCLIGQLDGEIPF